MKNLNEIFSKDELSYMVRCAMDGGIHFDFDDVVLEITEISNLKNKSDTEKIYFLHDSSYQELVVPIYGDSDKNIYFELHVSSNGNVFLSNDNGYKYMMRKPIEIYEVVIKKKDELRKLEEYFWKELTK